MSGGGAKNLCEQSGERESKNERSRAQNGRSRSGHVVVVSGDHRNGL